MKLQISDADARSASGLRPQLLEEADGVLYLGLDLAVHQVVVLKSRHDEIRYSVVLSNELLDELHGCMDMHGYAWMLLIGVSNVIETLANPEIISYI